MLLLLPFLLATSDLDVLLDDPKLAGAIVSCVVADESGTVIFQRNPALRVMPASNEKLLTCAFALRTLGPDYVPETRIWKLPDRTVVESSGDPLMTHERLQRAAAALRLDPSNPVYVREAYRPLVGPGWEWDDLPNKYAAPVTAFTVDRGSIELWGDARHFWLEPRNYGLHILSQAGTGARKVAYDPIRRTLTVSGDLPKARTRIDTLALDLPDSAAASYLGRRLVLTDERPTTPPSLTLGGPPLKDAIKECLVKSDNNIAENLLLMAAGRSGPLGDDPYGRAASALQAFLRDQVGTEPDDMRVSDGSGMSRHNLATTRGIVKVLAWALRQPTKDVWLDALATPGAGTLKSRLQNVPFVGKTGTLDAVVALSGYVRTAEGRTRIVSLILNHFACSEKDARSIADEFMQRLATQGTMSACARAQDQRSASSARNQSSARRNSSQWPDALHPAMTALPTLLQPTSLRSSLSNIQPGPGQ